MSEEDGPIGPPMSDEEYARLLRRERIWLQIVSVGLVAMCVLLLAVAYLLLKAV